MVDIEETGVEAVRPHTVLLALVVTVAACEAPQLAEVEEDVLTLTVAGDVTIDSINPAFGNVVILDPSGRSIAQTTLVWGRYRLGQELPKGVDVCVSSWQRAQPNTYPILAKAAGHYEAALRMSSGGMERGSFCCSRSATYFTM